MDDRSEPVLDSAGYECVTGHTILAADLNRVTEFVTLDGARVRLCREHGTPIAVTVPSGEPPPDL